jgi:penicillin amidase
MLKKVAIILVVILIVVVGVTIWAYLHFIKAPLPVTQGELKIGGLNAPVEVLRDQWGVPHIYAKNHHDLFFAQGFVQAQDRLFQMEINRRLASGRLSEIIGPEAVPVDRFLRTMGIMRASRAEYLTYAQADKEILQAFSDGITAFIKSRTDRLPIEFRLMGFKPEPWRPEHTIGWAKFMAMMGGKDWQEELVRSILARKMGNEKAASLLGLNKTGTKSIIPSALDLSALKLTRSPCPFIPSKGGASNNWVVHGSRTDTGSPLLENDMHLDVRIPSVWYEMHLTGGEYDVIGLSLPGVPMIIAGHNRHIAWGITFAYMDVEDVYMEKLNTEKPARYLYKGEWKDVKLIKEPIRIKGEDKPVIHEVMETIHGPIISNQVQKAKGLGYALALKWSAHDPGNINQGLKGLNLAGNFKEFKEAAQTWTDPSINLVYADRDGNIGYVLAGRIPKRLQDDGIGPFPGWSGENDWVGYVSADERPFLFNPPKGFIATANNRIAGANYPHYLSNDYLPGYRAERISGVLAGKTKISKGDFSTLMGDFKSLEASRFMNTIEKMEGQSTDTKDLLARLRSWDKTMGPESAEAAIYSVFFYRLLDNTFRDDLGDVTDLFLGKGLSQLKPLSTFVTHSRVILINLMSDPESPWFDDVTTPDRETLGHMIEKSLRETETFLKKSLGNDPSGWSWGKLHKMVIQHPLGQVKPLDKIFNLGPFETGGHFSTVWQSTLMPGMDFNYNGWTVSNRHIYDLQDWDKCLGSIVPGQSGMFGSPHYSDQMKLWLEVKQHPLYFSRAKVEAEARNRLMLMP